MRKRYTYRATLALGIATLSTNALAIPFFFIFPIPRGSVNPDKIDASLEQRKLAMCAAYHENVIDPEIDGKRETSYHGDVVSTVVNKLSSFTNSKKLIGAYIGQWRLQTKQSYQSGQDYARMLVEGCNYSNLPVNKIQHDVWKNAATAVTAKPFSIRDIPPQPIKLDEVISSADFPSKTVPVKARYAVSTTLQIDRSGKVVDCFIEASSGSELLDETTCDLLKQRAQFLPGSVDGVVAVSEFQYTYAWSNPTVASAPGMTAGTEPAQFSKVKAVPVAAPVQNVFAARPATGDVILDTAINRCDRIGFKRDTSEFRGCVTEQISLLSK